MAFKLSTGLRNALLGEQDTITAITLAAVSSTNSITDSGSGLFTAGFRPGDVVTISGFTESSNNGLATITSVASSGSSMIISGLTLSDESAGDSVTITANGKSWKDIFRNHVIRIYSGSAPADADAAETGTLLVEITLSSGTVTPGTSTNGLNFDSISSGVLSKDSNVHSGVGLVTGTAGYYRLYDNGRVTGISTTAKRAQGVVGTSGTDFIMSSTSIVLDAITTLDTHNITLPAS